MDDAWGARGAAVAAACRAAGRLTGASSLAVRRCRASRAAPAVRRLGRRPTGRGSSSKGLCRMQSRFVSVVSRVFELTIFAAAAAALGVGLLNLR